jgi:phenylacetate-coenzyme A ligase PaaK-like adenylate-forming protein
MIMPAPAPMNPWLWSHTLGETYAAGLDPLGVAQVQRDARLAQLLRTAWADSPFYAARRGHVADTARQLKHVEPVEKAELMHNFDAWATDRRITRSSVERFLAEPDNLAGAYLGRYLVWTSSGTSGEPGIFVQDAQSLAAFDALDALRLQGLGEPALGWPAWGGAQRFAFVAATGGHFAGVVSFERLRRIAAATPLPLQWLAPVLQTFSVLQPLDQLAAALSEFAPTVLVTYPSSADALAQMQAAGTLRLALSQVWLGGEQLSDEQRQRIRAAFGCSLRNNYGASEFYAMAFECAHGRLHLNHDWLILEPVDRQSRAVPPGEVSHSVLLTNLANRTQPLLRYRLGDSVRFLVEPCACGSSFTAIEVQGRADHSLVLHDAQRREVLLLPLALSTVIEEGAGITQFQLLCTAPTALELRFEGAVADPEAAFVRARGVLCEFLATHGLAQVSIASSSAAPLRHPRSGKVERVRYGAAPADAARKPTR